MLDNNKIPLDRRDFLKASALIPGSAVAASLVSATVANNALAYGTNDSSLFTGLCSSMSEDEIMKLPRVKQDLVAPPGAPQHEQVASGGPRVIEVTLVTHEMRWQVDDLGAEVWALTYNGSVPGPLIVCHEGDYVELTLINPKESAMEHNIDFHASTGALGGGTLTHVQPGQQTKLRWRAVKPGVFLYHCAPGGVMIPYHVVHGMNGAIMVLPRDGLKDKNGNPLSYDKVFYVGEQDFYVPRDADGNYKKYSMPGENLKDVLPLMAGLIPTHVVFNGKVGALTGDNAFKSRVGETALFVHVQANRDSRPHLIGGHGDYVWETGSFTDDPTTGLETWFIRGGSAGAAMYTFRQPGIYVYLNHNLIEAVQLGAASHVVVEGDWDDGLMKQVEKPGPIMA